MQAFLNGYTLACRQLGIPVTEQEQEFAEFQDWIEKQFNQPSTQSWARIILFYSEDESQALDTFFEPFEDFLHGTSPARSLSFRFKLIRGQTFPVWENLLHDYKFWKPLCSGFFSPFHYLTRGSRQRLRKS
ncbi:hypothetical protein [Microcoleus asticus]|uniref:hypothetical protein n=1 Tax=Microcoleus asticus TaxID=2815231 RepID=UPI001C12E6A6|nr:hypothetical protein [Microcoleus asticus]